VAETVLLPRNRDTLIGPKDPGGRNVLGAPRGRRGRADLGMIQSVSVTGEERGGFENDIMICLLG